MTLGTAMQNAENLKSSALYSFCNAQGQSVVDGVVECLSLLMCGKAPVISAKPTFAMKTVYNRLALFCIVDAGPAKGPSHVVRGPEAVGAHWVELQRKGTAACTIADTEVLPRDKSRRHIDSSTYAPRIA